MERRYDDREFEWKPIDSYEDFGEKKHVWVKEYLDIHSRSESELVTMALGDSEGRQLCLATLRPVVRILRRIHGDGSAQRYDYELESTSEGLPRDQKFIETATDYHFRTNPLSKGVWIYVPEKHGFLSNMYANAGFSLADSNEKLIGLSAGYLCLPREHDTPRNLHIA